MNKIFRNGRKSALLLTTLVVAIAVTAIACGQASAISCQRTGDTVNCTDNSGGNSFTVDVSSSAPAPTPVTCSLSGSSITCGSSTIDLADAASSLGIPSDDELKAMIAEAIASAPTGQIYVFDSNARDFNSVTGGTPIPNQVEFRSDETLVQIFATGFKSGESVSVSVTNSSGQSVALASSRNVGASGAVYFGDDVILPDSLEPNIDDPCECSTFTIIAVGNMDTTAVGGFVLQDKNVFD